MLEQIIFAIDNGDDIRQQAKFTRLMDQHAAMGMLIAPVVQCIGMFKGTLERSYMMYARDYEAYAKSFTKNQECILRIPGDTRQPCVLQYADGARVGIGPLHEIPKADIPHLDEWTYVETSDKYWAAG